VQNYQIFWIIKHHLHWPKFLEVIFCYGPHTWALQHIRGVIQLDISFICWFRVITWPSSYWFLHSEAFNGAGDKGSAETKMLMYTHSWRPLWTCPWDMPVSLTKHFLVKSKTSELGTTPLNCQIIRICILLDAGLQIMSKKYYIHSCLYYLQIFN